jgi:uracil-DNA glycosylase
LGFEGAGLAVHGVASRRIEVGLGCVRALLVAPLRVTVVIGLRLHDRDLHLPGCRRLQRPKPRGQGRRRGLGRGWLCV